MLGPNEVNVFLIAPAECVLVFSMWQTLSSDGKGMYGCCTPLSSSWTQLPMLPVYGFIRKKMGFKSARLGALCALQGRDKASLWFQPKGSFHSPTFLFFSNQGRDYWLSFRGCGPTPKGDLVLPFGEAVRMGRLRSAWYTLRGAV